MVNDEKEIEKGTNDIRMYVPDFDYSTDYQTVADDKKMIESYKSSSNNYEKLQLYRIITSTGNKNSEDVIMKFINETFHVENDYLFQLNPCEYEIVPEFIITECNRVIDDMSKPQNT